MGAQLHCVLIDIWNFMKMNVPGPNLFSLTMSEVGEVGGTQLFSRDFGPYKNHHVYCERLRVVMVSKIDTMATLFKKHFVDALKEGSDHGGGQNGLPIDDQ